MRIVLPVHAFPPRSTAGVEVYTLRLARALAARGHDVTVVTAVHDLAARPYDVRRRTYEGLPVIEIVNVHHRGTLEATYQDAEVEAALVPVLRDLRPECVHFQHLLNLSAGLLPAVRGMGARVLFTLHDYWLSCPRDGLRMREDLGLCATMDHTVCARCLVGSPYLVPPLQRTLSGAARGFGLGRHLHRLHDAAPRLTEAALAFLRRLRPPVTASLASDMDRRAAALRRAFTAADLVIAPSAFALERAIELGIDRSKGRVVPHGVLRGAPRDRPAGARLRFAFLGTLAPHKGVHVLIDAFRGVTHGDATLDLYGSETVQPSYVESLRRAASGDARIRFRGPFPEGGQERLLTEIDALVVPSIWWENSPLTIYEALGAGVPVVASRIGGIPELLAPPDAGLLVSPGDVAALRAALQSVANGAQLALARGPVPGKTVDAHAVELEALYRGD